MTTSYSVLSLNGECDFGKNDWPMSPKRTRGRDRKMCPEGITQDKVTQDKVTQEKLSSMTLASDSDSPTDMNSVFHREIFLRLETDDQEQKSCKTAPTHENGVDDLFGVSVSEQKEIEAEDELDCFMSVSVHGYTEKDSDDDSLELPIDYLFDPSMICKPVDAETEKILDVYFDHSGNKICVEKSTKLIYQRFRCTACPFTSYYLNDLLSHIDDDHLSNSSDSTDKDRKKRHLECSQCSFQCSKSGVMKEHMRHHKLSKQCHLCDFNCRNLQRMTRHVKKFHRNDIPLTCKKCGFTTRTFSLFTQHSQREHRQQWKTRLKCQFCDFEAFSRKSMDDHVTSTHIKRNYKCIKCSFSSCFKRSLTQHLKKIHRLSDIETKRAVSSFLYECSDCLWTGSDSVMLERHRLEQHSNALDEQSMNDCSPLHIVISSQSSDTDKPTESCSNLLQNGNGSELFFQRISDDKKVEKIGGSQVLNICELSQQISKDATASGNSLKTSDIRAFYINTDGDGNLAELGECNEPISGMCMYTDQPADTVMSLHETDKVSVIINKNQSVSDISRSLLEDGAHSKKNRLISGQKMVSCLQTGLIAPHDNSYILRNFYNDHSYLSGQTSIPGILTPCTVTLPPVLECEYCSFLTVSQHVLEEHMNCHAKAICQQCGYESHNAKAFLRHKRVIHSADNQLHCRVEGCSFRTCKYYDLTKHSNVHCSSQPFSCPYCELICGSIESLEQHLLLHQSISFLSPIKDINELAK